MISFVPSVDGVRNPERYLEEIWQTYFADVPRVNQVEIAYGRPWKRRLGMIQLENTITKITINTLLQLQEFPECILVTTVAHELTHYAHGFGSPLPRLYSHPHAHGVVTQELDRRGLGAFRRQCEAWIESQWFSLYERLHLSGFPSLPVGSADPIAASPALTR